MERRRVSGTPVKFKGKSTAFFKAVREVLREAGKGFPAGGAVKVFLFGGAAVHLYTAARVSKDVDAEFPPRVLLPSEVVVDYEDDRGRRHAVALDRQFSPTLGLLHEDYDMRAVLVDRPFRDGRLLVYVVAPVDLALSKVARWSDRDKADVETLAREGLLDAPELEDRGREALGVYIGDSRAVCFNLAEAVRIVRAARGAGAG